MGFFFVFFANPHKKEFPMVQNINSADKSEKKPVKKPPFKKLDMNALLDMSCWNPENFGEFEAWQEKVQNLPPEETDIPDYMGKRRYNITLHCVTITITARRHPDNKGYQIFGYVVQDH